MHTDNDFAHGLLDAHVHFYPCFDRDTFLDGALRNFTEAGTGLNLGTPALGVLLLTECAKDDFFHALRRSCGEPQTGRWQFAPAEEQCSIVAMREDVARLVLVAGRQIVTAEGLEVLAICCDSEFADGEPLQEVLQAVRTVDGIPVVPWGFGKWLFSRGGLLADQLDSQKPSEFFLGDNGGRLRCGPRPRLFSMAEERGIRVLPGTDPLPFRHHAGRAGSFGFLLSGGLDIDRPAERIRAHLLDPSFRPRAYGSGARLPSFVRDQLAMQVRKRLGRSAR